MVNRDELIDFIHQTIGHELLDKVQSFDQSANGIQVLGDKKVESVALGVSINLEFLQKSQA